MASGPIAGQDPPYRERPVEDELQQMLCHHIGSTSAHRARIQGEIYPLLEPRDGLLDDNAAGSRAAVDRALTRTHRTLARPQPRPAPMSRDPTASRHQQSTHRGHLAAQASKSTTRRSLVGTDWQARAKPASTSDGSSA